MNKDVFYSTTGEVERFAIENYEQTRHTVYFPEALIKMREMGLLKSRPSEAPAMSGFQTMDEFMAAFDAIPMNASFLIENSDEYLDDGTVAESAIFPESKDIYCIRHMPYMTPDLHSHAYFEITVICRGSCSMMFNGASVAMAEGDLCIVPPSSLHSQPLLPGCFAMAIMVRKSTFDYLFGELLVHDDPLSVFFRESLFDKHKSNYVSFHLDLEDIELRSYLQMLACECHKDDFLSNSCAVSLFKLLLARVLREYGDSITIYDGGSLSGNFDYGRIMQYIMMNYRDITLSELSHEFNYNEAYLSRMVKKYTGQSFVEIVKSLRLQKAADYLINSDLRISEIAPLSGYGSVDHFTRTFKDVYKMTPLAYRNNHKSSASVPEQVPFRQP